MKDFTTSEINKLQKEADKHWNKYCELKDKIKDLKLEAINVAKYINKYIKYEDESGYVYYMKVDDVMRDRLRFTNFDFSYEFRGLGFCGEFTGYDDATSFDWSYWENFYIYGDLNKLQEKIDKITEITKEEFNTEFEKCIEKLKEYHYKTI